MIRMNLTPIFATYGSSSFIDDQSIPTYIAIVNKKDGTTTTKCLNPSSKRRRSSTPSSYPLKKQLSSTSFFLPKLSLYNKKRKRQPSVQSNKDLSELDDKNVIYNLPLEIIQTVLNHLDYQSILILSSTCKYVNQLCKDNYVWHQRFQQDFHIPSSNINRDQYMTLYQNHCMLAHRWLEGEVKTQYLQGHEGSIYCLARLNKNQFISGSRDRTLRIWHMNQQFDKKDAMTTKPIITKKTNHQGSILCLKVSQNSNLMITGSSDATCALWDTRTFTLLFTFQEHHHGVLDVCFLDTSDQNNKMTYFASASRDHTVCIWSYDHQTNQGKLCHRLLGHVGPVNALDKYDNQHVLSASADGTLKLWNSQTGSCIKTFISSPSSNNNNNNNNQSDQQDNQQQSLNGLACIKYDSKNQLIYGGGQDGKLRIWNINTEESMTILSGHHNLIRTMDLMQDGKMLVTGSYDKTIRVWDLQKQQCILSFQSGHSSWIFNLMVTRSKIISAGQDHQIMMLDFAHELGLIDD